MKKSMRIREGINMNFKIISHMASLEFSLNLPTQPSELMKLSEDYVNLPKYLPDQLKLIKIIDKTETGTITEETIVFSTLLKKNIIQQTNHKKDKENQLTSEIISGPAKGTKIITLFEKNDSGSKVSMQLDLKLNLKAKILRPIILKYYKMVLTSVLYKMNTEIIKMETK
jgi:ribosome-associated toxin RatA of RatAB toxin-antitoxin module|tara:strand:+ start:438 stop:947 length:510 start_codon:yes stop_codon:yes gene_type:complete